MSLLTWPPSRLQLAVIAVVVAAYVCFFAFTLHRWSDRLFILGFLATGSAAVCMIYAWRALGDRAALIPAFIGVAGVLTQVILTTTQNPQPLIVAGWIGIGAGATGWVAYFLARLRHAPAASSEKAPSDT